MSVAYFLLLSSLGLVINIQAQDCPVPVGGDNMGLKGNDILLETFPNGIQVTFECNAGYVSSGGSPAITCTDGSWSPVKLKCEKKNCGPADEVLNGNIDYSEGTEFGAKLVVTCKTGYRLVGKSEVFCGVQGWMGRMPECEVVTCNPPNPVVAGTYSPIEESYGYLQVVQYTCQKDYTLNGSKSLSCSETGTFKPAPPTCVMVECTDPDIRFAEFLGGSRPPHKYKSTVTYRCVPGYTMEGAGTLTCGINNLWLPGLPTCQPVQCKDPVIENGVLDGASQPPYNHMSTVTLKCDPGYTMKGAGTLTCGIDGQWSPGLPTCEPVQCKDPAIKNGFLDGDSQPPYNHMSTVTFKCDPGYTMKGEGNLTCGIDGQWSPGLPTCELISITTRPSTTQKTIVDTGLPDPPENKGNDLVTGLCSALGVTVFLGITGFFVWRWQASKKRREHGVGSA